MLLCVAAAGGSHGGPVRSGFSSGTLDPADDGSSGPVNLGFGVDFYGTTHSQLYINNNGNVTFGSNLDLFTSGELAGQGRAILAPFFADVDTSSGGSVTFGTGQVGGRDAFAATWSGVGYALGNANKANDFQVVIIDRGDIAPGSFDVEFNYDRVEWETGDFSGGVDGLGGSSARAGWASGTGSSFEIAGSGVNGAFLDGGPAETNLAGDSVNSDTAGRQVYFGRNGVITSDPDADDPGPVDPNPHPTVPEPATLVMAAAGLAGLRVWRRRNAERRA